MGGELAGDRTQDPRLKRALLYQLSYELENLLNCLKCVAYSSFSLLTENPSFR
jgi:hypothetical protein